MKEVELVLRVIDMDSEEAEEDIWSFGEMNEALAAFFAQNLKKSIQKQWQAETLAEEESA